MPMDRNPFWNIEEQFDRLQRQFEDALEQWNVERGREGAPARAQTMGIDLADHGDEFVLTADVPGFEKDDIDLRISGKSLNISARREEATQQGGPDERYIRSERAHRALQRSVRLPGPVDETAVSATHRNGVLTVTLPKEQPTEPDGRSIDIE